MRRRDIVQMTKGDLIAEAQEDKRRFERLDSEGLCRYCGEKPQNPHIGTGTCMECYNKEIPGQCEVRNCPNKSAYIFKGAPLCKPHLADSVHASYKEYLSMKSELEEIKEELAIKCQQYNIDPTALDRGKSQHTHICEMLLQLRDQMLSLDRETMFLKSEIKSCVSSNIKVFPENYEVFG